MIFIFSKKLLNNFNTLQEVNGGGGGNRTRATKLYVNN